MSGPLFHKSVRDGKKIQSQLRRPRMIRFTPNCSLIKSKKHIPTQLDRKLGNRISELRKSLRTTQKQLGELIGTTQSGISRIESGKSNLTIKTLKIISKIFGKNLHVEIK